MKKTKYIYYERNAYIYQARVPKYYLLTFYNVGIDTIRKDK